MRHAREFGFSLDAVRELLDLSDHPERPSEEADIMEPTVGDHGSCVHERRDESSPFEPKRHPMARDANAERRLTLEYGEPSGRCPASHLVDALVARDSAPGATTADSVRIAAEQVLPVEAVPGHGHA